MALKLVLKDEVEFKGHDAQDNDPELICTLNIASSPGLPHGKFVDISDFLKFVIKKNCPVFAHDFSVNVSEKVDSIL